MSLKFLITSVEGVKIEITKFLADHGRSFYETYKRSKLPHNCIPNSFQQRNISIFKKDVLPRLHFQNYPFAQGKLISVMFGKMFDVVVVLRKDFSTFRNNASAILTAEEGK